MYRITYGDNVIFDPYDEELKVTDASMSDEINAAAYLDFTISVLHPLYDTIQEHDKVVCLYFNGSTLFQGIVYSIESDIQGNKIISCVSAMDYLNDTVVRPYSTVASEADLLAPTSIDGYFQWLIDQHNDHVMDLGKRFEIGINQGGSLSKSNYIAPSSTSYSTTASEISSNIIDPYGGYLTLRYDGNRKILDLYSDVHEMNAQIIDFGINIVDITKTIDTESQYTALIPQGGSPAIEDGGFESNSYSEWVVHPDTKLVGGQVHQGSHASYFTSGNGEYVNKVVFYAKNGRRYKGTIWVKNERSSDVVVHFGYQINTDGDWDNVDVQNGSLSVPNDGEWHEFSVDFMLNASEYDKIRPRWYFDSVSNDNGKRVYVDDLDFRQIDGDSDIEEDPIDLKLVADGIAPRNSGVAIEGDALYSIDAVREYGYREKVWRDDAITDVDDLLEAAVVQLNKLRNPVLSITVKAIDLSLYMDNYDHLQVGQAVRVRSKLHDLDEYFMVSSIALDLQDPKQTEYTLGVSYDTFTGQQSSYIRSLNSGINSSLDSVASIDQTIKDQAVQIGSVEAIANDAKDTANSAQQAAQDAQNSASSALDKAEAAEGAVNEIQGMIDDINSGAEQAKQDAAQAKADAEQAAAKADAAAEKADSYQQQITDVTTTVNGVVQEVEGYSAQIAGAVEDAGVALSAVTSLEADVDGFKTSVSQTYQTKQDAAEQMAQEVLDRNSAIEQSASEITQSVSETYQVKGDYLTEGQAAEVYASKAELSTTADAITATVEEKFDDSLLVKEADGGIVDCGDTAGMPLAGLTVYGETRQNLWNQVSKTQNGITVTANTNGSVTVSGTSTSSTLIIFDSSVYALKPGSTYTFSVDKLLSTSSDAGGFFIQRTYDGSSTTIVHLNGTTTTARTFTVPDNAESCKFGLQVLNGHTVSGTYRVMLNEGSEPQPWCPPGLNSVEDVTVWQSGKNLYNADDFAEKTTISVEDGVITVSAGFDGWDSTGAIGTFIPKGTKVSIKKEIISGESNVTASFGPGLFLVDSTGRHVLDHDFSVYGTYNERTDTLPEDVYAFTAYINAKPSGEVKMKVQFEIADAPTDFEPANLISTPIDLLGNKVSSLPDGTRDELVVDAGGAVTLVKKCGIYAIDGNEDWFKLSGRETVFGVNSWTSDVKNEVLNPNRFLNDSLPNGVNTVGIDGKSGLVVNGQYQLYVSVAGNSDMDVVTGFFKSRETSVLYPLATSQEIPLGTVDLPDLPERNAHVWISTGTQGMYPDIHATWYAENASALKDFASRAELKIESDQIKAMVEETYTTKDEVSTTYATKSEVTQTASSIKSEVSETYTTKEEFNGLEVGGRNLILDSYIDETSGLYGFATRNLSIDLVEGETYAFYANGRVINGSGRLVVYVYTPSWSSSQYISTSSKTDTTFGKIFTASVSGRYVFSAFSYLSQGTAGGDVHLNWTKLEKGNKPTDWTPAPEDMLSASDAQATYATKTSVSTVEQTVDSLTSTVQSNYTTLNNKFGNYYTKTQVDQKDSSIKSTVSEVQTTANNALTKASTVEQTADGLEVRLIQAEKDVDTAQSTANSAKTAATNAAKTATNYLNFDSAGLCVGNMTSSTLGYNALITSTAYKLRNGSSELASFGASQIELGKNSNVAQVYFAQKSGSIAGYTNTGYPGISVRASDGSFIAVDPLHVKCDVGSGGGGHFGFDMYANGNVSYISGTVSTGASSEESCNVPMSRLIDLLKDMAHPVGSVMILKGSKSPTPNDLGFPGTWSVCAIGMQVVGTGLGFAGSQVHVNNDWSMGVEPYDGGWDEVFWLDLFPNSGNSTRTTSTVWLRTA